MERAPRRARDLELLDAIDACPREKFAGKVWRVAREGRDPLLGAASRSRWCDGSFDVLYTSLERDGAIAEVYAYLSLQPVFPSKIRWFEHKIEAVADRALVFVDISALGPIGVETATYQARDYSRTQAIADAACFLGFDGLIAPSARWNCQNLALFTEQIAPDRLALVQKAPEPIDWENWRRRSS